MTILVDNGHGINVYGKCSPDRRLFEWKYTREIALLVVDALVGMGYDARLLVPEDYDVKINTTESIRWNKYFSEKWDGYKSIISRVLRVNKVCAEKGYRNVVLVSIHNNASSADARWHGAKGFSVFCSKKASDNSKSLAEMFYRQAVERGLMGNRSVPKPDDHGRHFWTWSWRKDDISILTETLCPAVLTENMFMDNQEDLEFLLSERGRQEIVGLHVESIVRYANAVEGNL